MTPQLTASFLRLLSGARATWLGCGPELRQRVYFANHTSNLDGPVLWATLPLAVRQLTRPVAARDYWTANRLRRFFAEQVFNAVLIERKAPTVRDNPIEDMLAAIGDSHSLILFPEGGRFSGPDPQPFKSGLFHLAKKRPEIELVPVLLDNMNLATLREAVQINAGRAILEVSGGVTIDTVAALAQTGVDRISIGGLTKDVKATDYSMRFEGI